MDAGASTVSDTQWGFTDTALIAASFIAGTMTHRYGTEEERADLDAIAHAARSTLHLPRSQPQDFGNPQDAPESQ